jgi:hypothetical protein
VYMVHRIVSNHPKKEQTLNSTIKHRLVRQTKLPEACGE